MNLELWMEQTARDIINLTINIDKIKAKISSLEKEILVLEQIYEAESTLFSRKIFLALNHPDSIGVYESSLASFLEARIAR